MTKQMRMARKEENKMVRTDDGHIVTNADCNSNIKCLPLGADVAAPFGISKTHLNSAKLCDPDKLVLNFSNILIYRETRSSCRLVLFLLRFLALPASNLSPKTGSRN
jgi:hypothetical protein